MKYSFMSFSTPQMSLQDMLELARRYGYDGIEPRIDAKHAHGAEADATAEQRAAIREQVKSSGLTLACLATSLTYSDPSRRDEIIRMSHERIDLAGDLGVPVIRVFGGRIAEGLDRAEAIELVAGSLSEIASHAAERNVTVCVETHDDWCNPADVAAVLSRVDHPAIAANWDIMHPVRAGGATMDSAFQALKPWIRHLHIHDGTLADGKLAPIGTGYVDHRRAIELLMGTDFDGFISGEWIGWEPYEVHLPRELATMKNYERELSGK